MNLLAKATICLFALSAPDVFAQTAAPRQDPDAIQAAAKQFLALQTTGLPGDVSIAIGRIDPRLNVAACAALQAFMPGGSRAWG